MPTTTVYDKLIADLAGGELEPLEQTVLDILNRVRPAGMGREELVLYVFGYWPVDVSRDVCDRKCRKAIEALRALSIPIVSSSGSAGYRLDVSERALNAMRDELLSRISKLTTRVQGIERALYKIRKIGIEAIPARVPKQERVEQPVLFGRMS